jgi:SNF2 family DNA or RNA helicase
MIRSELYEHQKEGVKWLLKQERKGGGILSDEQGLGKTIQTIYLIKYSWKFKKKFQSTLIVVPTSLIDQWIEEIERFSGYKVLKFHGSDRCFDSMRKEYYSDDIDDRIQPLIVITTYGTLASTQSINECDPIFLWKWARVICDEAHELKNMSSKKTKSFMKLYSKSLFFLTATPVQNNLKEFLTYIYLLTNDPDIKILQKRASKMSTVPKLQKYWDYFVLRRTKNSIKRTNPEEKLPPIRYLTRKIEFAPEEQEGYDILWNKFIEKFEDFSHHRTEENTHIHIFAALSLLRRFCDHSWLSGTKKQKKMLTRYLTGKKKGYIPPSSKLKSVFRDMINLLKRDNDEGILIFSQWTSVLDIISHYLDKLDINYVRMDGTVPQNKRSDLINTFQTPGGPRLFLISLKTGGVGLNLTRASSALIIEPYWNIAIEEQAIHRIHRYGQVNPTTVIRYVINSETSIEKFMKELQKNKNVHISTLEESKVLTKNLPDLKLLYSYIQKMKREEKKRKREKENGQKKKKRKILE